MACGVYVGFFSVLYGYRSYLIPATVHCITTLKYVLGISHFKRNEIVSCLPSMFSFSAKDQGLSCLETFYATFCLILGEELDALEVPRWPLNWSAGMV
jgi:hypothetical protein